MSVTSVSLSSLKPRTSTVFLIFVAVLGTAGLTALIGQGEIRLAVAATVLVTLIAMALYDLRIAVLGCLTYLVFLADLRRVLIYTDAWTSTDPLLLIGPTFAILLFFYLLARGRLPFDTPLALCVIVLMGIMGAQIFNPKQGGLIVGVAGVIFTMTPLFWFWIGRAFGTERFLDILIFRLLLALGLLSVAFGLYQVFYGYLPYQIAWFKVGGYGSLGSIQDGLAPISFFASGTEHGAFGIITGIILLTLGLKKNRGALLLLPIILVATLLTGSRGPVAKFVLVASCLWAIQGPTVKSWTVRGVLILVLAGLGLYGGLSYVTSAGVSNPVVQNRLNRQADEFVRGDGAGNQASTQLHFNMLLHGYRVAMQEPLGRGLGATSLAAKLGGRGASGESTETDLGNSFLALGIPGGLVYHLLVVLIVVTGLRLWFYTRSRYSMAILGILGVTVFTWLGGGQYAVAPIVWICVGALDRLYRHRIGETS